jgi:hypothetical protein
MTHRLYDKKSRMPIVSQHNIVSFPDHTTAQGNKAIDTVATEFATLVQTHRQTFDMSLDETLEGLQGVQQVLNILRVACFSVPTSSPTSAVKLKVQRASYHCTMLMTEVRQLLQPFSQELQILLNAPEASSNVSGSPVNNALAHADTSVQEAGEEKDQC